jgi:alkylation response protein AidB-like acyl-CoA dehydrogenase
VNQSAYQRFKNTFESAHGKQTPSPFSKLMSGQIDYALIAKCLANWKIQADPTNPLLDEIQHWLLAEVDPEKIEEKAQIPDSYLQGLRLLNCMRARIPEQYGGLGISQCQYSRLLEKLGSWSEVLALVVSVQQLGVAQGLLSAHKLEQQRGEAEHQSEKLRSHYLRKLAEDATGAFSLTTPETGSDPSRLQTIAEVTEDNDFYELNGSWKAGSKLYTTLGTIADVYIMLAVVIYPGETVSEVDPRKRITAFIVDRNTPGIHIKALDFCGWHGLPNAAIKLDKVRVPQQNRVGRVGDGLKIAFMNLGSGRINIAAISLGMMKQLERIARWWGVEREQGGKPIGEHELNTEQLVKMNAFIYANEAFLQFVSTLVDQPNSDIRLEAAMLKLFSSHSLVDIADETLQLRGGRGYETHASQTRRGETAIAVERLFRSARMMKIGEGGSNILQLYIMRCLLDDWLKDYKNIAAKELSWWRKYLNFFSIGVHYVQGYLFSGAKADLPPLPLALKRHVRYVVKQKQHLHRILLCKIIGEYLSYYRKLGQKFINKQAANDIVKPVDSFEQRQVLLGHCAQIAMMLSVMTVCCLRAGRDADPESIELADEFCLRGRAIITAHFIAIASHNNKREQAIREHGKKIMRGAYASHVEDNIAPINLPNIKEND